MRSQKEASRIDPLHIYLKLFRFLPSRALPQVPLLSSSHFVHSAAGTDSHASHSLGELQALWAGRRKRNRRFGRNEVSPTAIITCTHRTSFFGLIIISPSIHAHIHPLREASIDSFVQPVIQHLMAPPQVNIALVSNT